MEPQKYYIASKSRIDKAGNNIRAGIDTPEDIEIVESWRAAHRGVLNTFQAILRIRTKDKNITVAQRHKRKVTIFNKLDRLPKMQLSRMDDVAGCRLIFRTIDELNTFRNIFHSARFAHRRRNDTDKYDYIKSPKATGYRGIHDVYEYDVNSKYNKILNGLYIEVQYRTLVQHAWATAVEVIGFITDNKPKFQSGDRRYQDAMAYASEMLARVHENTYGPFRDISDTIVLKRFLKLDKELSLLKTLSGLNEAQETLTSRKNIILIFSNDGTLETRSFRDAPDAFKNLFELENIFPNKDIVLVRADRPDDIKLAFKNYFSNAKDFLDLINQCIETMPHG